MLIDRYGIHFGDLIYLRFYGLIIMLGVVAAAALSFRQARKWNENTDMVYDLLPWLLVFGVIGARIWHVLTPSAASGLTVGYYLQNPLQIVMIWRGGLGIPGAVIGGAIALFWYTRRRGASFARWADIIAPGLLLAQAIGRWGNFVNQELYGPPTTVPWGIQIDPAHRFGPYVDLNRFPPEQRFHPTFLYESIWNLVGFVFLLWVGRRYAHRLRDGDITFFYLIYYAAGRLWIEILRPDAWLIGPLPAAQLFALGLMIAGLVAYYLRHRRWQPPETWYQHRHTLAGETPGSGPTQATEAA